MDDAALEKGLNPEADVQSVMEENARLKRLFNIIETLAKERDLERLAPLVMSETSKFLNADRSSLFLIDWEHMEMWSQFAEGMEDSEIRMAIRIGLVGQSVMTGKVINVTDAYNDLRFNREVDEITGIRTERVLCAPFFDRSGDTVGALELINKKTGPFTEADENTLLETASHFTAMNSDIDPKQAEDLLREVRLDTNCDYGTVFILDRKSGQLSSLVTEGLKDLKISMNMNLGIAGLVATTGQELNIPDAHSDPRFDKTTDERTGYRTKSILGMPLKDHRGDTIGVLEAINKKSGAFTEVDAVLFRVLSYQIAFFIENAILLSEQQKQFASMLNVLAASIDAKDPYTSGHSQRVAKYATNIARKIGFNETEIECLNVAALLHDYGKLGTDENILKKPGKLTREEYEHIKQHVVKTREILDKMHFIPQYRTVPLVASSHHERLDGSGYAEGLNERSIPFMAKILAVADVFEALISDRHYRNAISPRDAIQILEQGAGTQFDANIIEVFKRYWYAEGSKNRP